MRIIYKIYNTITGKAYVGQTSTSLKQRMGQHIRGKQYIDRSIQKYGIDAFEITILDDKAKTQEELNELEIYYIALHETLHPNGYNLCIGGNTTTGYTHTEEAKRKMSETKKASGVHEGENNHFYNKSHTDETRRKMVEAWTDERKEKLSHWSKNVRDNSYNCRKVRNVTTNEEFDSVTEAGEYYGIFATHISRVCRGKRKTTHGYVFEYIN